MDNTAKEIYHLLPNGKCPICKAQVRVIASEYTLYKTRLVMMFKKHNKPMIKCPNCKTMVNAD